MPWSGEREFSRSNAKDITDLDLRLFVAVGQTLLMISLAEYCTIWPTAGGQQ